ncbi:hypothetical protein GCM10017711_38830 [Paeniglutamicibacter sulfureus]
MADSAAEESACAHYPLTRSAFLRWDGLGGAQAAITCHEIWKTQPMNDNGQAHEQLDLLNAIREALERREEVFQIIDEAPDESTALTRLAELLDIGESGCHAILHMQVSHWLGTWRDGLEEKAESLRLHLERNATQP